MVWCRPIVGHNDFEIQIRLSCQCTHYRQQRIAAVVGRDHNGHGLGRIHFELDYATGKSFTTCPAPPNTNIPDEQDFRLHHCL